MAYDELLWHSPVHVGEARQKSPLPPTPPSRTGEGLGVGDSSAGNRIPTVNLQTPSVHGSSSTVLPPCLAGRSYLSVRLSRFTCWAVTSPVRASYRTVPGRAGGTRVR